MPIYEYACEFCGQHTETIQKADEAPVVDCPACGKPGLHRLLSAPAFQLKGQGWYVTDFRDKKPTTEHKTNLEHKTNPDTPTAETKITKEESKKE